MAYQNVGTPRFYVNILEWMDAIGAKPFSSYEGNNPDQAVDLFKTIPTKSHLAVDHYYLKMRGMTNKSFVALIGHNHTFANWLEQTSVDSPITQYYQLQASYQEWQEGGATAPSFVSTFNNPGQPSVNDYGHEDAVRGVHYGFTLCGFDGTNAGESYEIDRFSVSSSAQPNDMKRVCSVVIGTYYDMPHNSELKLTMTREMDGVKRIRTKSGKDLISSRYTKQPTWPDGFAPFEVFGVENYMNDPPADLIPLILPPASLARPGRRIWDLSFKFLDGGDMFGPNQLILTRSSTGSPFYYPFYDNESELDNTDFQGGNLGYKSNLLNDDNFYSQVLHKTKGGQLPFIFQPDNTNNSPDSFAIAKLDMKSFKFKQVSNRMYNIKLKIREIW